MQSVIFVDYNDGGDGQGSLEDSIPGVPGTDYPIYAQIPETGFTCEGKVKSSEIILQKDDILKC